MSHFPLGSSLRKSLLWHVVFGVTGKEGDTVQWEGEPLKRGYLLGDAAKIQLLCLPLCWGFCVELSLLLTLPSAASTPSRGGLFVLPPKFVHCIPCTSYSVCQNSLSSLLFVLSHEILREVASVWLRADVMAVLSPAEYRFLFSVC